MDSGESADDFDHLLRPHLNKLYRLSFRLTGSVADAEDLLQDVLTKLYTRRDELSSISDLSPWLGRVLYNQFVDQHRRFAAQRLRVVSEAESDPEDWVSPEPGPEVSTLRQFDISELQDALARLSDDHRLAVLLHDAEGYSLEEIQGITGVPVGTLKSRLHRARARMREFLAEKGTESR